DAEGAKTAMHAWMDAAELRAKGKSAEEVKKIIAQRFADGTYPPPSRAGISYMIAPLMRTYPSPDPASKEVMTMNMPHYMIYATRVTDPEIGGKFGSPYPFILGTGGQDYIIILMGNAEKAQVLEEHKDLLHDLCVYRPYLCSPPHLHS